MIDILNVFVFYVLEFEIIFCLGKLINGYINFE